MFVRQYPFKAPDGRELKSFQLVRFRDELPEGIELFELTREPQSFSYAGYQFCGCPERHSALAEGIVKIYEIPSGPRLDWSEVKDPSFPCARSKAGHLTHK